MEQELKDLRDSIDELTRAINGLNEGSIYAGNLADQIGWAAHQLQKINEANESKQKES